MPVATSTGYCDGAEEARELHGVVAEAVLAATDARRVEVDLREMTDDEKHVRRAIELARRARERGNHPFGALLVADDFAGAIYRITYAAE